MTPAQFEELYKDLSDEDKLFVDLWQDTNRQLKRIADEIMRKVQDE